MRLGRLPHSPAALARVPALYAYRPAAAPPERLMRPGIAYAPQMGDNREQPDCTAESLREVATAQAAVSGGWTLPFGPRRALRFYAECLDRPDATDAELAATEGADMLHVAARQITAGFDSGFDRLAALYGSLPLDRAHLADAAFTFGMAQLGVTLMQRDMDEMFSAAPLDHDGSDPGAVVGGHALAGPWEYTGLDDEDEAVIVTYGMVRPVTWRWVRARTQLALAYWWRQLCPAGMAPGDADVLAGGLRGMAAG